MSKLVCKECDDEGYFDVDVGGGKTRKEFCDCEKGQRLLERAEFAYWDHIDQKIDEYMERKIYEPLIERERKRRIR